MQMYDACGTHVDTRMHADTHTHAHNPYMHMHDNASMHTCMHVGTRMHADTHTRTQSIYVTRPAKIDHVSTKKSPIFSVFAVSKLNNYTTAAEFHGLSSAAYGNGMVHSE